MNRLPFFQYFMKSTVALYSIIVRIDSILGMTDKELCSKNKCLTIKMILKKMESDLQEIEKQVLNEEIVFLESEICECQQNISALNLRFTINLN